jgi:hypothetical protein
MEPPTLNADARFGRIIRQGHRKKHAGFDDQQTGNLSEERYDEKSYDCREGCTLRSVTCLAE